MNEALQALEVKVENGGATQQGKFFARDWNTLIEAVKALDLKELDEASLRKFLKDNGYITSEDVPEVDLSSVVTLATEQRITGSKDFVGGIKVNGQPLIYNAELGVWQLEGDLLVTGGVAWFASIKGFKPSTIMDAVQVDGESIVINELGQLKAIGGGSGGSGGGLTISDLSNYLTTNKYTKQSDVESLIATALTPYALTSAIPTNNNQLTNGAGYITSSALTGYATEQWVGEQGYITSHQDISHLLSKTDAANTYLAKSGGVISGTLYIDSSQTSDTPLSLSSRYADANGANRIQFIDSNNQFQGYVMAGWGHLMLSHKSYNQIGVGGDLGVWCSNDNGNTRYQIIHSNNIGSYNAGSATKLQTARTIWGYSFDGTADVNGTIYNVDVIRNSRSNWIIGEASLDGEVHIGSASFAQARTLYNANGMLSLLANGTFRLLRRENTPPLVHSILMYEAAPYGLLTRINTDGSVSLQAQREANDAECFRLLLNPLGGNVAIGGTTADAKLHVHGDIKTTSLRADYVMSSSSTTDGYYVGLASSGAPPYKGLLLYTYGGTPISMYTGNTMRMAIGAEGDVTIYGNLFVNGGLSWVSQSQRSLKNIISEQGLSLAQLERIKPIKFYWKDGRDAVLHVGGVADVFAEVLPEVVSHWKNTLCLNYVDASFYTAASLIAPVVDHERRIAQLERENEALKQKLNQLAA